ncbi:MAG: FMN-binding negative transcriptional regulator [Candidatus Tumulicola sp.]
MYVPPAFSVADRDFALDLIARYPFGLLLGCDAAFPYATHLPMLALQRDGELWIAGHVARANPHARAILEAEPATAVFSGPHAYVSAGWYEEPATNVPTWNYTAAHASGRLEQREAGAILGLLTAVFERERAQPWELEGMDAAYYENQLRGIVAFEMRVERLVCAAKLSQNRTSADRGRVVEELSRSSRPLDRDCAQAMRDVARGGQSPP